MNIVLSTLNAKYIHTSLALRYLKAYSDADFDIQIAEYTINDPAMNIVSDLFQKQPDIIGFSCYIWNIEETIVVINMLKKILPDVKIILGGPEVSYDTRYWMERLDDVDFIVIGEGEETFNHLLKELHTTNKFHFVFGVAYRKGAEILINPSRPKLDLDDIPSPHRFAEDLPSLANRVVYFETSRGCPFSCQFCLSSIEVGVRYFSMERTKQDILYLIESGAKLIKFVDRTFNIKRDYALEVFDFLIKNHNGCIFQFEITADIMRPEVLEFLAEHAPPGIFRFEIGVQSTNDETNELIQRRQNFTKLSRTVSIIRDSNKILQHLDLIAGLPEEDYDSFRKTFNDVFALRAEELQLGFLKMLRGTGLRNDAEKYGYTYMDHAPYEILSNNVLSFADIVRIKRVEDVLEKYWNAHRMDRTVDFLVTHEFETAFDFFQQFGDFWEERGWQKIGHQLEDLFVRLMMFLREQNIQHLDVVEGLMKLEYCLGHKYKPRKIWWEASFDKKEQAAWLKLLAAEPERVSAPPNRVSADRSSRSSVDPSHVSADPSSRSPVDTSHVSAEFSELGELGEPGLNFSDLGLTERDLHKHTVIEQLPFDLAQLLTRGVIDRSAETLLIVHYSEPSAEALAANPHASWANFYTLPLPLRTD